MLPRGADITVHAVGQTDRLLPVDPVNDTRQEQFHRSLAAMLGQTMEGEVTAKLADGSFLVKIQDAAARMQLPAGTQAGSKVPLTLVSVEPRPTFQLQESDQVILSQAGPATGKETLVYQESARSGAPTAAAATNAGTANAVPAPAPAPAAHAAQVAAAYAQTAGGLGAGALRQSLRAPGAVLTPPAASAPTAAGAAAPATNAAASAAAPLLAAMQSTPPARSAGQTSPLLQHEGAANALPEAELAAAAEADMAPAPLRAGPAAAPASAAAAQNTAAFASANPAARPAAPASTAMPGVATPGVTTPGLTTPAVVTPGVATPGVATPGVITPGLATPSTLADGISRPAAMPASASAPGVATPATASAPGAAASAPPAPLMAALLAQFQGGLNLSDAVRAQTILQAAALLSKAPLVPASRLPALDAGTAPTSLSATGLALANVLAANTGSTPLAVSPARPLLEAGPQDAPQLAAKLEQAISQSGLFYESHLAEWAEGARSLSLLAQEPQMQKDDKRQTDTVQFVNQQLNTQEQARVVWHGPVWPNMQMQWDLQRQRKQQSAAAPDEDGQDTWRSSLRLHLPGLGEIEARIVLQGESLALQLVAADSSSAAALQQATPALESALAAAGLELQGLRVQGAKHG